MAKTNMLVAALASSASAVRLYATNYAPDVPEGLGSVTTLEFTPGLAEGQGAAALKNISASQECGAAPTWLDTTQGGDLLYCLDEGWGPTQPENATLNTLKINEDGSLQRVAESLIIQGPVTTQFYNGGKAVVIAHYGAQAVSTFTVGEDKTTFTPLQNFTFDTPPGPNPNQEKSHPHQAILDPTGQYVVVPDLGSDLVRVFCIDPATSLLNEHASLTLKPGYGPRHAVFWSPDEKPTNETTFMYLVNELSNKLTTYQVGYLESGGLVFTELQDLGLFGDKPIPEGGRAAEIFVSPDNKFVTTSQRNATSVVDPIANPDPNNSTQIPSDSLSVWKPTKEGKVEFVQLAQSGGSFPRHFSYNKDGSMIAVGNQLSFTVDIFKRDIETGKIGERLASAINLPGQVNNVIWDEE